MSNTENLKPCPFCGGVAKIAISDDEGNDRHEDYEQHPWSGLSFKISHVADENEGCPIASHWGETIGTYLYESREELIKTWNLRHSN
ncbi:Lar family restriction alleviation protein [Psychrobacillus sp. FSL K6-2365]|uniref:Lar family restriction alleviation protein n=1 Tax=Psychrobacillus sp. FSL K6-2365 TaxID=2921546 RepID=UPI0030F6E269